MRRYFIVLLAAFVALIPSVGAGGKVSTRSLFGELGARFKTMPVIYADFSQVKTLTALSRPLYASGRLIIIRDRGLIWEVEKPYKMMFVIGEHSLREVRPDGSVRKRMLREVPAVSHISRLFRALLSGDKEVLGDYFDIHVEGDASAWELQLLPRGKLSSYLKSIVVKGGEFIEQILLEESSGDRTLIRFYSQRTASAPSADEQRLFDSK